VSDEGTAKDAPITYLLASEARCPAVTMGMMASASGLGLLATSAWLITRASLRPPILTLSVAIAAVRAFAIARALTRYLERLSVHSLAISLVGWLRIELFDAFARLLPGGLHERTGKSSTPFSPTLMRSASPAPAD